MPAHDFGEMFMILMISNMPRRIQMTGRDARNPEMFNEIRL